MKTIIAGSRGVTDYKLLCDVVRESGYRITELVSGGARGVDQLGERWAKENSVPIKQFLPDWKTHGKSAGHVRNRQMGDYAQALVAVWDGQSRGTKGMIDYAEKKHLHMFVKTITPTSELLKGEK